VIRVIDNIDPEHDRPARLLERHSEHRRVEVLAALAANPHTLHGAITDALNVLRPAELALRKALVMPRGTVQRPDPGSENRTVQCRRFQKRVSQRCSRRYCAALVSRYSA
jgi:hypothetical protein